MKRTKFTTDEKNIEVVDDKKMVSRADDREKSNDAGHSNFMAYLTGMTLNACLGVKDVSDFSIKALAEGFIGMKSSGFKAGILSSQILMLYKEGMNLYEQSKNYTNAQQKAPYINLALKMMDRQIQMFKELDKDGLYSEQNMSIGEVNVEKGGTATVTQIQQQKKGGTHGEENQ